MNENPHSSISRTSLITGVSQYKTYNIIKNRGLFPYKMSVMQQLSITDHATRLQMCNFFMQKFSIDPDFHKKLFLAMRRCFM